MNNLQAILLKAIIIFLIVSLSGIGFIFNYQQILLYAFVPLIFFVGLSLNRFSFNSFKNFYSKIFLGIIITGILLLSVSTDLEVGVRNLLTLSGVYFVIITTLEFSYYRKIDFNETFLVSFVVAFVVIVAFLLKEISENGISVDTRWIDREQFDFNANVYSYFSYFANIALFYLIQIHWRKRYIILSIICLFLGTYVSFFTASRSGIIFTILIGIIYWGFIFDKLKLKPFFKIIILVIFLVIGSRYMYGIYNESYLQTRVDASLQSGDSREVLIMDAINVFIDHPFTGVGPGQFYLYAFNKHSFSHNSYTEVAANLGIVGLVLLLILFIRPLWYELRRKSIYYNKTISKLNILFFVTFILMNNIYVFYLTTYGMIFFFVIILIQKRNIG